MYEKFVFNFSTTENYMRFYNEVVHVHIYIYIVAYIWIPMDMQANRHHQFFHYLSHRI